MNKTAGALSVAIVAALITAAPAAADSRPHAQLADPGKIGQRPVVVRDATMPRAGARRLKRVERDAGLSGRDYTVSSGETVRVLLSPSYVPDDSVGQSWADLFAGFVHSSELSSVTVILA